MLNNKKTIIEISGMSCNHCASRIETSLSKLPNIKKVIVDLSSNTATITSSKDLDIKEVQNTVEDLGYKFIKVQ